MLTEQLNWKKTETLTQIRQSIFDLKNHLKIDFEQQPTN